HEIDRIDIRVAYINGSPQHLIAFEQSCVSGDFEDGFDGRRESAAKIFTELLEIFWDKRQIVMRRYERIGFRHHHFDQIYGGLKERAVAVHIGEFGFASSRDCVCKRLTDSQPRRQHKPGLRPSKYPWNCA